MTLIVCIVTAICLLLNFCQTIESKLTEVPSDNTAFPGDSVTFQCFTENREYPPVWSHVKVGSSDSKDVYLVARDKENNNRIVGRMMEGYHGRFSVDENRETGQYNLQITEVSPYDAGVYTCTARGGLGQKASAQLMVLESSPECSSNVTEAVGENICNVSPDTIAVSCKFRFRGSGSPDVLWIDLNQLDKVVKIDKPALKDAEGNTISNFIIRGDRMALSGTSFRCIVSSAERQNDGRFYCSTPTINVLKISNLTESMLVTAPDEVECKSLPNLPSDGCKWVRRNLNEDETVVSTKSLLNLHRSDLTAGTYVCIVECKFRGQVCPIEALTVTYEPSSSGYRTTGADSSVNSTAVSVALLLVFAIAIVALAAYFIRRKLKQRKTETTKNNNKPSHIDPKLAKPGTNGDVSEAKREEEGRTEQRNPLISKLDVEVEITGANLGKSETNGNGSGPNRPEEGRTEESNTLISNSDVGIDIPDAKLGKPGSKAERTRLIEERALARMREHAMRQGEENPGLSSTPENTDVAEGLAADKKND